MTRARASRRVSSLDPDERTSTPPRLTRPPTSRVPYPQTGCLATVVTDQTLQREVLESDVPVLVDFGRVVRSLPQIAPLIVNSRRSIRVSSSVRATNARRARRLGATANEGGETNGGERLTMEAID